MLGVLVGGAAGGAMIWSPWREVQVRGRLTLTGIDSGSKTLQEHAAAILGNTELLNRAGATAGLDLAELKQRVHSDRKGGDRPSP
jgi:hypothetical protein